jgi:hypothetical protein
MISQGSLQDLVGNLHLAEALIGPIPVLREFFHLGEIFNLHNYWHN